MTAQETKNEIRKKALRFRNALSVLEIEEKSRAICRTVIESAWFAKAGELLVYAAVRTEARLDLLVETALKEGKAVYFPKVDGNDMDFYRIRDVSELKEGAFHVPEPPETGRKWEAAGGGRENGGKQKSLGGGEENGGKRKSPGGGEENGGKRKSPGSKEESDDFFIKSACRILVPGAAFQQNGFRIGYGKGYYDRYLSRFPMLYPIGIAYEQQIFPAWEPQECDIPVREIITEKGVKEIDGS